MVVVRSRTEQDDDEVGHPESEVPMARRVGGDGARPVQGHGVLTGIEEGDGVLDDALARPGLDVVVGAQPPAHRRRVALPAVLVRLQPYQARPRVRSLNPKSCKFFLCQRCTCVRWGARVRVCVCVWEWAPLLSLSLKNSIRRRATARSWTADGMMSSSEVAAVALSM